MSGVSPGGLSQAAPYKLILRIERSAARPSGPCAAEPATYRPDIDGWRAVAVVAVVAHHFDKTWLPGGYLGVDMFFVISGFVITLSLLSRKVETFPILSCGVLRATRSRLLPALLACVLVTSIAVWFVDPAPRQSIGTGIAALFGVSNILLTVAGRRLLQPVDRIECVHAHVVAWRRRTLLSVLPADPLVLRQAASAGCSRHAQFSLHSRGCR